MMRPISAELLQKYNVPAPRYTSYPTVPFWENNLENNQWISLVKKAYNEFGDQEGITLYIHLPYCESLCTYCGCNKRITKNHAVEMPYIMAIMKEWQTYLKILPSKPKLAGIHLGGGTPTFFFPESLREMLEFINESTEVLPGAEFSFEGHPNNTTREHLQILFDLGFRRVSYGVQDFDLEVQKAIHRIQPLEKVEQACDMAREIGYESINFDLIYGLPHQTLETMEETFREVGNLRPDRIAFYSYAHLPSAFPSQKSFEKFLPKESEKRYLYEKGKILLNQMGYLEIGMDHFALPGDALFVAKTEKSLHRNFMGYTTSPSKILLGLGNSAISDVHYAYGQNTKEIDLYKEQMALGHLALSKAHGQTEEDIQTKKLILELICNQNTNWNLCFFTLLGKDIWDKLKEFQSENLIRFDTAGMEILEAGIPFIRNICMVFDKRMKNRNEKKFTFSKAI